MRFRNFAPANMIDRLMARFIRHRTVREPHPSIVQYDESKIPSQIRESEASENRGNQYLGDGKLDDAAECYRQSLALNPRCAEVHNKLGFVYQLMGNSDQAIELYRKALECDANLTTAHQNLGFVLFNLGQYDAAEISLRRVAALTPEHFEAIYCLGLIASRRNDLTQAETLLWRALELRPDFFDAQHNLGVLLAQVGRHYEAEKSFRAMLDLRPDFIPAYRHLGNTLIVLRRLDEAEVVFRRAVALDPRDADLLIDLGNVLVATGRIAESYDSFRGAQQIRPLTLKRGREKNPNFSALILQSPGVLCIPDNYLVGGTEYDSYFLSMLPDSEYDIDLLRAKADVVVNLISDADSCKRVLPIAQELVDRIGRPTINHPNMIPATDRKTVSNRLSGIRMCRIPKLASFSKADMDAADWIKRIDGFSTPMLIRCAGTHGGADFEKINDVGSITQFVSRHADATYYVSEFVDYRSPDGYYRKYRLMCIDNEILPYHLAIHTDWLVHYFRTDMANYEWMTKEEEAFLKNLHSVFNDDHLLALREVVATIGLDYFGVDCSFDRIGNIVIFEANATMLVHDEKDPSFVHKNPYIAKIKDAFDGMLANRATGTRTQRSQ